MVSGIWVGEEYEDCCGQGDPDPVLRRWSGAFGKARRALERKDFEGLKAALGQAVAGARAREFFSGSGGGDMDDCERRTLLWLAARYGDDRAVDWLLDLGLDPNARDPQGQTALYAAASVAHENGEWGCLQKLLQAGADPNVVDDSGCAPLLHALWSRSEVPVKMLLAAGADPNCADLRSGDCALCDALGSKNRLCVKALVEAGAHLGKAEPWEPVEWAMRKDSAAGLAEMCEHMPEVKESWRLNGEVFALEAAKDGKFVFLEEMADFWLENWRAEAPEVFCGAMAAARDWKEGAVRRGRVFRVLGAERREASRQRLLVKLEAIALESAAQTGAPKGRGDCKSL